MRLPSHGTSPASFRTRSSSSAPGTPAFIRSACRSAGGSASPSGVRRPSVPTGAISVIPHDVITRSPCRSSSPRTSDSGAAAPPITIVRSADRSYTPGQASSRSSTPSQTVGTPALKVTRSALAELEQRCGVEVRAGEDEPRAGERRGVGQSPGVGVEHRDHGEHDVGRADARSSRPSRSPSSAAPARGASRPRPSSGRWCPRCSTSRPRRARRARAGRRRRSGAAGEQRLVVEHAGRGRPPSADHDDMAEAGPLPEPLQQRQQRRVHDQTRSSACRAM